jgi:MFS family permease
MRDEVNQAIEQSPEPRYAWVMVTIAFIFLGMAFGALVTISVFLKPLVLEFGWSRGDTSFAYTVGAGASGGGGIVMGWMSDRFSTRPVVLFGSIMMGLPLLLLSNVNTIWQLYLFYGIVGGLGFGAMTVPMVSNVGQWFNRNKGLALGITSAGGAFGQAMVPFFTRYLITLSGWRVAYTTLAFIFWALLIPLSLLVRTPPSLTKDSHSASSESTPVTSSVSPITTIKLVIWLSVAVIFCCICMATPIIHVVALATDKGVDSQIAAGVLSSIMIAGLFGRIMFGKIADHMGGLRAYLLASLFQTVLVFWFTQLHSAAAFYILAMLFGLGFSGVMTGVWVCVREMIPPEFGGLSLGITSLFAMIGMGLGGYQGGFFFDLTGNYTFSFINAALAGVVNLIILASLVFLIHRKRSGLETEFGNGKNI